MSDEFQKREKGYEAKFKMDEELRFKAESRRNRLLGEWAAGLMGLPGDKAAAYAKEVVRTDLEEPGVEDVVRKLVKDLKGSGVDITADQVRAELDRLYPLALQQVAEEFPESLDVSHPRFGG